MGTYVLEDVDSQREQPAVLVERDIHVVDLGASLCHRAKVLTACLHILDRATEQPRQDGSYDELRVQADLAAERAADIRDDYS